MMHGSSDRTENQRTEVAAARAWETRVYSLRDGRRVDDRLHDTARSVEGFHRREKALLNSVPDGMLLSSRYWHPMAADENRAPRPRLIGGAQNRTRQRYEENELFSGLDSVAGL
jgi:hypothetical protein